MNKAEEILQGAGLDLPITDPLVVAMEAACYAAARAGGAMETAESAVNSLPPNVSPFQRGLTFGLAFALAVPA